MAGAAGWRIVIGLCFPYTTGTSFTGSSTSDISIWALRFQLLPVLCFTQEGVVRFIYPLQRLQTRLYSA